MAAGYSLASIDDITISPGTDSPQANWSGRLAMLVLADADAERYFVICSKLPSYFHP